MLYPLARAAPGLLHNQSPRLWPQFFLQTRRVPTPRNFDSQPGPRSPGHGLSTKQRRVHASKTALFFAMDENNRRTGRSRSRGRARAAFACSSALEQPVPFFPVHRRFRQEVFPKRSINSFASLGLVCLFRRFCHGLFFEILLFQNVVTSLDSFACRFHLVAIKDQRGPIADHTDNKVLWRFRKGARNLVQRPNLLAIDFVDNAAAVWREIC